jgi:monoterpene epsilon-lactone hydrolase
MHVDLKQPPYHFKAKACLFGVRWYKAAQRTSDPKNMAIFGTSAGGALTMEMILRAKEQGVVLPGAISAGTPMSDATKTGDSFYTNEMVDNVLVNTHVIHEVLAETQAGLDGKSSRFLRLSSGSLDQIC